jgi:hypothetical protein
MLLNARRAVAAASLLGFASPTLAQDGAGGIWASRPRLHHISRPAKPPAAANSLQGLASGQVVQAGGGKMLGTVSQIVTGEDGAIREVIVTSPTGQTYRLAPATLSISGGVVTTTDASAGG